MESDINTKKTNPTASNQEINALDMSDRWSKAGRSSKSMTTKILQVNIISLLILAFGILYLDNYKASLIEAELNTLRAEVSLFSDIFAEGAIRPTSTNTDTYTPGMEEEKLIPELASKMVQRVSENRDRRTLIYDEQGTLIIDSKELLENLKSEITITKLPEPDKPLPFNQVIEEAIFKIMDTFSQENKLPYLSTTSPQFFNALKYDVRRALDGSTQFNAWKNEKDELIITAVAPIQNVKKIQGAVLLIREGQSIRKTILKAQMRIILIFFATASITTLLSLYLSATIGHPLRTLAIAAERVQREKNKDIEIPDLSNRGDEIGELSLALRAMNQAFWERMDTIESFAADVAHELKNPLSSLRSAIETAPKVKKEEQRQKLMDIMNHDVQRLDRLITDISKASRLDAELSRETLSHIKIIPFMQNLCERYKKPIDRIEKNTPQITNQVILEVSNLNKSSTILGNASRLVQVFENLISNALSFSPTNENVTIRLRETETKIIIEVDDKGPGIPEKKLNHIFERFYSERPKSERFGSHSGLGLSICKQIIKAHGGKIFASNILNADDKIVGARFTVILKGHNT